MPPILAKNLIFVYIITLQCVGLILNDNLDDYKTF